jgi:hypothetical protein
MAQLSVEQRELARRLRARGWRLREIGAQVGCSFDTVRLVVGGARVRPGRPDVWWPAPGRLRLAEGMRVVLIGKTPSC